MTRRDALVAALTGGAATAAPLAAAIYKPGDYPAESSNLRQRVFIDGGEAEDCYHLRIHDDGVNATASCYVRDDRGSLDPFRRTVRTGKLRLEPA